jgi:hypothetical protein
MSEDVPLDDAPEFEDVAHDLEVAGLLLAAAAREDHQAVAELRALSETDWWNVAWTLALLLSKFRAGDHQSVELVEYYAGTGTDAPADTSSE